MIILDDPDDERYAAFRLNERGLASRADKRDDAGAGLFLAEGDLVVERALDAGCVPVAGLVDRNRPPSIAERLDCPVYAAGEQVRQAVTRLGMPQRIVALFERPARPSARDLLTQSKRVVVLEGIDNPANVGAIVRNAVGLGWDALVLDHTSADPLSRRALRAAMGTIFALPHARTTALAGDVAAAVDTEFLALTPDPQAAVIADVRRSGPVGLLVGSERDGLSNTMLERGTPVRIPMADGVDSLNAAAATAIACYALRR
ncbi:MAG: RNA methyltransferase [Ilumatobacteraceae bacterium]|nr:RNA methyltransferase [Ilumatobacteraceae bacterium]